MPQLLSLQFTINEDHPDSTNHGAKLNEFKELMTSKLVVPNIQTITISDTNNSILLECDVMELDKIQPTVDYLIKGTAEDEDPIWFVDYEIKHHLDVTVTSETYLQSRFRSHHLFIGKVLADGSTVVGFSNCSEHEPTVLLKHPTPRFIDMRQDIRSLLTPDLTGWRMWSLQELQACRQANMLFPVGTPVIKIRTAGFDHFASVDARDDVHLFETQCGQHLQNSVQNPYYFLMKEVTESYLKSNGAL